jgi:hypothetical protein
MRYMMLICTDEQGVDSPTADASGVSPEYAAFMQEFGGVLQGGERLRPSTTATTVRVRDGEVLTSDGPFAETKEQVGGYFVVDAKDLDHAIEVASRIPTAAHGSIEVRPIWEM